MLQRFLQHWRSLLPHSPQKIVVALSGGIDSVVLLHLLQRVKGLQLLAIHVNFQLRGEESERDEAFCRQLCAEMGIALLVERVNTQQYAAQHRLSTQQAARELRYGIFEREKLNFQAPYIATAHHAGDSIETFFINFSKGCGLRGLHGIQALKNDILRPLLPFTRSEIAQYAQDNALQWAEDSSNASDKYTRNFLRLRILPLFGELQPRYEQIFSENIRRLAAAESLYDWALTKLRADYFKNEVLDLQGLMQENPPIDLPTVLHEWLQGYGFTPAQCREMAQPRVESGKSWKSSDFHVVYKHTPAPHLRIEARKI